MRSTSQDTEMVPRSSRKRSRKPIVDTARECLCDPETLTDMGQGFRPDGQIYHCPKCGIVGKLEYHEISSISPLRFTRPLRGK